MSGTTGGDTLCTVMDGGLTFGPLATTRRACTDPTLAQQEQTFLTDLSEVVSYEVAGSMLKLTTSSGKVLQLARPVTWDQRTEAGRTVGALCWREQSPRLSTVHRPLPWRSDS